MATDGLRSHDDIVTAAEAAISAAVATAAAQMQQAQSFLADPGSAPAKGLAEPIRPGAADPPAAA